MSSTIGTEAEDDAPHMRLSFDLDVEVCVIGGGLAGLTTALLTARTGASVALLEARRVGWGASGHHLGTVMPGYDVAIDERIARVGLGHAGELWKLSQGGVDLIRALAQEPAMGDLALSDGALEVSNVDIGDRLIARLQMLGDDFGVEVEGWQVDQVRAALKTRRYFHGVHYPRAFQLDGAAYLRGLVALARQAGVRIFEDTPVTGLDFGGIRKRIVTPSARMRAGQVVLAGNVTLGDALPRLAATLLPVWRHAALTAPLGERLAEVVGYPGSVMDADGVDHFRIIDGDRLMWSSPETTWDARSKRFAGTLQRRIRTIFPALGKVAIERTFSGAVGQTVHGMPQIGEIRPGLWVASGFSRQGLNTSAMAGDLIARGIADKDDRWKLFSPFELVWAGGVTGRIAGQGFGAWTRGTSAAGGLAARYREGASRRHVAREARLAAANRKAMLRSSPGSTPPSRASDRPSKESDSPPGGTV